jgi:GH15 family glucan-1,4-alpha-glucosidase
VNSSERLHVLREYALLADGERGAVVGPDGQIAWLCAPRWDSPAVFSSLLGGRGHYSIAPVGRWVWGGSYEGASMIWRSRWVTEDGVVECREALAYPGDPGRVVLLRRLSCERSAIVEIRLHPRGGYDHEPMRDVSAIGEGWIARVGNLWLRWTGAAAAATPRAVDDSVELSLICHLDGGTRADFALEISESPLPTAPPHPDAAWAVTEQAWASAVPELGHTLDPWHTRRSHAVLTGMTSRGGGMVAAATAGLPERAEEGRNYDYRYVWIRDQCYAGIAGAAAGTHELVDPAVSFVSARLLEHADRLCPAYTTTGEAIPPPRHIQLPGYPGGSDIVGNRVIDQFQLDIFGEALQLFAAAAKLDRLDAEHLRAARLAADAIGRRSGESDAGIWELGERPWTHSRLSAAAGLFALAGVESDPARARDQQSLAERLVADTTAHALHPGGHWMRSPDDPALDAALLLPGLRGAVPADDPRTRATLAAYLRTLTHHGFAYRFRHDDRPLPEAEGSFLLCGFLVALGLHQQGEAVQARAWYERTRSASGPPRLFSEEFDDVQFQLRGNLPQAFVHALHVESAARLTVP